MAAPSVNKSTQKGQDPSVLAYLIAYNVAQVMGWSAIMLALVSHVAMERDFKGVYEKVAPLLNIFQTAAVLESQDVLGVTMFVFAWTLTEMIRYSFYMFSLIGEVPFVIQWCRYTFFIVLYPIGVTGELLSVWASLPYVQETGLYSLPMPNKLNFAFRYDYYLKFFMLMYIPVFPQLYMHMLAQRQKVIGGAGKSKAD
ncbi:HACD2-like protein [Mya arenaria]|uniref:Very-long-chain (3R)-3-hydroxyacyl-CoA dehydratase n=1 Tax=Mya arenaria TaxID=6604 RepID=A0ABY7F4W0_MYAAR|nr:HACD2-like protein [Mya arenaria]